MCVEHWRNDADGWEPMCVEEKRIRSANLSTTNFTGLSSNSARTSAVES